MDSLLLCALGFLLVVTYLRTLYFKKMHDRYAPPLPPGPKKLPIIGNMLDMPTKSEWLQYHEWCKTYKSDIIHLSAAGTSIIILDSVEAANDLLSKRAPNYSDRPRSVMVHELIDWNWNFVFMPYASRWKQSRKMFSQEFTPSVIGRYEGQQVKSTQHLLLKLLKRPEDWYEAVRSMAGEAILSVAYGIDALPENDPYIDLTARAMAGINQASIPGAFLVDFIPILKYVPEWIPGAGFKRKAKHWRQLAIDMIEFPFDVVQDRLAKGTAVPSYTSRHLESLDPKADNEAQLQLIKETAGSMASAGSETIVGVLLTFFLAMVYNPSIQYRAQAEIDSIIGPTRLPSLADADSLPYVSALVKELFRWRPVTPLVPHSVGVEDEYKGWRIPRGSIVMANSWAMLHDESVYPDPLAFNPSRFLDTSGQLDPSVRDPSVAAFGFGRRICPGQHMAIASVWIAIAPMLACFDIRKKVGGDGREVEVSGEMSSGLGSILVLPFECDIKPRSRDIEQLIRSIC